MWGKREEILTGRFEFGFQGQGKSESLDILAVEMQGVHFWKSQRNSPVGKKSGDFTIISKSREISSE